MFGIEEEVGSDQPAEDTTDLTLSGKFSINEDLCLNSYIRGNIFN